MAPSRVTVGPMATQRAKRARTRLTSTSSRRATPQRQVPLVARPRNQPSLAFGELRLGQPFGLAGLLLHSA